jgi:hypothetical protein
MKKVFREFVNIVLIALGILSAGMGLKGFLLSSRHLAGVSGGTVKKRDLH